MEQVMGLVDMLECIRHCGGIRGITGKEETKILVEKNLGGRAPKFEHCLQDVLSMQPGERAVLTVLLLRGPQSAGEIRQRTDRLHPFSSLDEVEETLTWFIEYPHGPHGPHGPLVRRIPVGEGRRVETFAHLLSPAAADGSFVTCAPPQPPTPLRITIGVPPSKRDSPASRFIDVNP